MSHNGRRGILGRGAGSGSNPTLSYNGWTNATPATASYTFSGVPFGTAASGRVVVIAINYALVGAPTISSVTIGGVTATLAVKVVATSQPRMSYIYYAVVPSGTSGNVEIVTSAAIGQLTNVISYSLYGLSSSAPTTTGVANNDTLSVSPSQSITLTPSSGGLLVAVFNCAGADAGAAATWTNATENLDALQTGTNFVSAASATNLSGSSLTVSVTNADT
ncbi:MAG: hypothetical protein ACR2IJ_06740, partial [Fluviibacter sp.]